MTPFDAMMALVVGSFALLAWATFMLFRNHWVYRQRTRILFEDIRKYERLPSYDVMMWRWWVWDIDRFLAPK